MNLLILLILGYQEILEKALNQLHCIYILQAGSWVITSSGFTNEVGRSLLK